MFSSTYHLSTIKNNEVPWYVYSYYIDNKHLNITHTIQLTKERRIY